jgi:hypothetical protein
MSEIKNFIKVSTKIWQEPKNFLAEVVKFQFSKNDLIKYVSALALIPTLGAAISYYQAYQIAQVVPGFAEIPGMEKFASELMKSVFAWDMAIAQIVLSFVTSIVGFFLLLELLPRLAESMFKAKSNDSNLGAVILGMSFNGQVLSFGGIVVSFLLLQLGALGAMISTLFSIAILVLAIFLGYRFLQAIDDFYQLKSLLNAFLLLLVNGIIIAAVSFVLSMVIVPIIMMIF